MDLAAYAQIEDLGQIAKANNIVVPRLRGYRWMKDEEPIPVEEIKDLMKSSEIRVCEDLCRAEPFWNPNANCFAYSSWTDYLRDYYLIKEIDKELTDIYGREKYRYTGIRWDRIHGWKRKILKFEIKKKKKRIQNQFDMWNKYAGNEKILYIHSRIGGPNWNSYGGNELSKLPWFLDKVDDHFDNTYCDIYALIK